MAQRMAFCNMQILRNSKVLSEYSHIFTYDLPMAASCYIGKSSSCDRLELYCLQS
ncbi:hypothetical protein I79_001819 [Cricetulus griseus]|uniref:Uncharacterized protein n=1 Tax=Cricetulus griseus TaxID=10029 RepID=G3GVS2_CRIGR|nr:hypothetical protein I79_001819 [Cricetulus griseus]